MNLRCTSHLLVHEATLHIACAVARRKNKGEELLELGLVDTQIEPHASAIFQGLAR